MVKLVPDMVHMPLLTPTPNVIVDALKFMALTEEPVELNVPHDML